MKHKKCIQIPLNGKLTMPDHISETDFVLRVTSVPIITNAIVIDRQVNFSGHVLICIETVSSKSTGSQTVSFTSFETPFVGLLNHGCARANMDVQLKASIVHQEFKMLTSKCIRKLIVVNVSILRLTKSCKSLNAHCFEPRLTLLSNNHHPLACFADHAQDNTDTQSIALSIEPADFHLPQTITKCNLEHTANIPCAICGCIIDPI